MGFLNIFKKKQQREKNELLPPLEDPYALPTNVDELKEWHYKVLRRLHKHAEKDLFSGYVTLEVDIPEFIKVAQKLDLIILTEYRSSLHCLKNDTLKKILARHELKSTGNKQQLVDRILSDISEVDVRSSEEYSDFYILTEKGQALVDDSYMRFQTEHTAFFKQCADLIVKNKLDDAYRMICKRNAEKPVPPGMNCDWKKRYYEGLVTFRTIYECQMKNSKNKIITAAAIYANMSGDGLRNVECYLKNAYCMENDIRDSLFYAHSLLSTELHFDSYAKYGIKKYRFLSSLDEFTCPICGKLDGQVFDLKAKRIGVNCPPMHKGCRCTTISANTPKCTDTRFARDSNGRGIEVPASMNWEMWKEQYLKK